MTPSLVPPMAFDPHKELVPITMVTSNPMMVVANAAAPFNNVKELVAAAKEKPGAINYGTPGTGTTGHVSGEWLSVAAQIKLQHVPFRGGQAAANSIAAGDVPLGVIHPASTMSFVDAGKMKIIALTGKARPSFAPPAWQTLAENGLPVDVVLWTGLFAPAGTPTAVVTRLSQEVARVLRDDGVRKSLNNLGVDPDPVALSAFAERIRADAARYEQVIKQTGIRVER